MPAPVDCSGVCLVASSRHDIARAHADADVVALGSLGPRWVLLVA